MSDKHKIISLAAVCLLAILAACGSGGGDSSKKSGLPSDANGPNVTATTPRYAYVANQNDNTVSIYAVESSTGQLRASGNEVPLVFSLPRGGVHATSFSFF